MLEPYWNSLRLVYPPFWIDCRVFESVSVTVSEGNPSLSALCINIV